MLRGIANLADLMVNDGAESWIILSVARRVIHITLSLSNLIQDLLRYQVRQLEYWLVLQGGQVLASGLQRAAGGRLQGGRHLHHGYLLGKSLRIPTGEARLGVLSLASRLLVRAGLLLVDPVDGFSVFVLDPRLDCGLFNRLSLGGHGVYEDLALLVRHFFVLASH